MLYEDFQDKFSEGLESARKCKTSIIEIIV